MLELGGGTSWTATAARPTIDSRRLPAVAWRPVNADRLRLADSRHVRHEHRGGKAVSWETMDGRPGLGDDHLADLIYLPGGRLPPLPARVVVTEGEKAADAVWAAGIAAVGTVCGASSTPGPAVAALFAGVRVALWPDADPIGRDHMGRFGRALELAGVAELRVVDWRDAPEHGDAADVGDPRTIRALVRASRWMGPVR